MAAQIPSEALENIPPKSKKWLWLSLLVIILGAGGGATWYFLFHKTEDKPEEHQSSESAEPPIFVEMLPFTVNLPPDGQFLQASFTLQLTDNADAENLTLYTPKVRSQILMLLSSKIAENLLLLEGKTLLTQEIMSLLNQPPEHGLKPIKVTHVLITSFIIQ